MSLEANKALVRRYVDSWNRNDLAALDEIVAEDVIDHGAYAGQPAGREGYRDFYRYWQRCFPGFQCTLQDLVAEGDRVAMRWTFSGRHLGDYEGVPPTGREVTFTANSIVRIAGGLIVEEWIVFDQHGLLRQLGAALDG
jgi:steroid delta-isomerase-like uncharacterized protein